MKTCSAILVCVILLVLAAVTSLAIAVDAEVKKLSIGEAEQLRWEELAKSREAVVTSYNHLIDKTSDLYRVKALVSDRDAFASSGRTPVVGVYYANDEWRSAKIDPVALGALWSSVYDYQKNLDSTTRSLEKRIVDSTPELKRAGKIDEAIKESQHIRDFSWVNPPLDVKLEAGTTWEFKGKVDVRNFWNAGVAVRNETIRKDGSVRIVVLQAKDHEVQVNMTVFVEGEKPETGMFTMKMDKDFFSIHYPKTSLAHIDNVGSQYDGRDEVSINLTYGLPTNAAAAAIADAQRSTTMVVKMKRKVEQ